MARCGDCKKQIDEFHVSPCTKELEGEVSETMESELTPQDKVDRKMGINDKLAKQLKARGFVMRFFDVDNFDELTTGAYKIDEVVEVVQAALAARDKGEGAKGRPVPVVDKWTRDAQKLIREAADLLRKERNPAVEILSLQSQLTTALERVREYQDLVLASMTLEVVFPNKGGFAIVGIITRAEDGFLTNAKRLSPPVETKEGFASALEAARWIESEAFSFQALSQVDGRE